jgi:uncharacterized protein YjbI with pentapeptide repeats
MRMTGCQLVAPRFNGAVLEQCAFDESTLTDADFSGATAISVSFYRCKAERLRCANAGMNKGIFSEAVLCDANFSGAHLEMANFSGADLSRVRFVGAGLEYAMLRKVTAPQASFDSARLLGTNFHAAQLEGCIWNNANHDQIRPQDAERLAAESWQPTV